VVPACLFTLGVLLVAHSVVTVLWQEPFTRIGTAKAQDQATIKLDSLMRRPVPLADAVTIAQASGERARIRLIGEREAFRTKEGEPLGRLKIPRIDVSYAFLQGTGEKTLTRGPGHYAGTAMPGQGTTVGIAGHRTTYDAPFRNIDKLETGDRIELAMPYGTFTYEVTGHRIVKPDDTSVLRHGAADKLVLTACWPLYSAAKRIAVSAKLVRTRTSPGARVGPDGRLLAGLPALTTGPRRVRTAIPALTARPQWNVAG
jgi:sortase A